MTTSPYDAAGGRSGLLALAHAWHRRCLADPVVEHAFSHGFREDHGERLAAYWVEALGGPADYTEMLGETETGAVRLHAGNGEHDEMNRRAVACFVDALGDVGLTSEPLRTTLVDYFTWATDHINGYHRSPDDVPADLSLPHWTWDGLDVRRQGG